MRTFLISLGLLLATTGHADWRKNCRHQLHVRFQAVRQEAKQCRLDHGTSTTIITTTTTTTTTSTTLGCSLAFATIIDTPCGRAVICGGGGGSLGQISPGRMFCAAGSDAFNVYFPYAPPPAGGPVTGGCTGNFSTTGAASAFSCPTCCPAGVSIPATRAVCFSNSHVFRICPTGPDFDACCASSSPAGAFF